MTVRQRRAHRRGTPAAGTRYSAAHRPPLPPGHLQAMVLAHLRAHPDLDFSPSELANVLDRPKSRGAVINACRHWVALGLAVRTQHTPQRYQAAHSLSGQ
jgi:hypothetical protein